MPSAGAVGKLACQSCSMQTRKSTQKRAFLGSAVVLRRRAEKQQCPRPGRSATAAQDKMEGTYRHRPFADQRLLSIVRRKAAITARAKRTADYCAPAPSNGLSTTSDDSTVAAF